MSPYFVKAEAIRLYREPFSVLLWTLGYYCVYLAFDGDEVIYVGASHTGLARPLSSSHHRLKVVSAYDILAIPVRDAGDYTALWKVEAVLTAIFQPRLNSRSGSAWACQGPTLGRLVEVLRQERWNQEHVAMRREWALTQK